MNPTYDFTGQVALVTGGSSGMAVVLSDINEDTLRTATDDLTTAGHQVLGVRCDVSDEDSVAAMVKATVDTFGRLDMAFNNAGIQVPPSDAADEPAEVFDRVNAINLRGVWACMKHELAQMRAQGSGAIVNCSSLGGLVGLPGRAAYHASKHGVIGLTRSAALEYAPRGIRINAVCPGTIETPMVTDVIAKGELEMTEAVANQPIARLGRPDEIAASVLWLCSPAPASSSASPYLWTALHRTLITRTRVNSHQGQPQGALLGEHYPDEGRISTRSTDVPKLCNPVRNHPWLRPIRADHC